MNRLRAAIFWVGSAVGIRRGAKAGQRSQSWAELADVARSDWEAAELHFQSVTDPLLVDEAVHRLIAAEKRYRYILGIARLEYGRGINDSGRA